MHEYTAELRIYGKDLNVADVTSDLGLEPSLVFRRGDKISKTKRVKESLWASCVPYEKLPCKRPQVFELAKT
jgi:hypothetical protein